MELGPKIHFSNSEVGLRIISVKSGNLVETLHENGRYEYELDTPGYSIAERAGILLHSRINQQNEQGTIQPGNFVGLLPLRLIEKQSGKTINEVYVEVRSRKLSYDDEYRAMLEEIADRCADFLLQLESPVEQQFKPDDEIQEATLAQRLYFLKNLIGGNGFRVALQRIIEMPNTRWEEELQTTDIRRIKRFSRLDVRRLASGYRRTEIPKNHPLHSVITTAPDRIRVRNKLDSADTPENRFVKHTLKIYHHTLVELVHRIPNRPGKSFPGLTEEINSLADFLEETLSHPFFKAVSRPEILPLNSPILQRKEGYRQVLRAWLIFDLAAKLSWGGGCDVYGAGKRDAATLYEYWVFFKLLDLVADLFDLRKPPVKSLINDEDLVFKLQAGRQISLMGTYNGSGRSLSVEFSYNRTFDSAPAYPNKGSWSRRMRPDYTLSLWPSEFSQDEAEDQEIISHIHFDAKYKIDNLRKLFGNQDEALDEVQAYEDQPQAAGAYKRADMLKMHAYRDAIRRSAGAYVLYPGTQEINFIGFHEVLPGLGAFPLRPNENIDGTLELAQFLKEIVAHVSNRATQREQQTYHIYRIHKSDPPTAIRESLPESDYFTSQRAGAPSETAVLVGYYRDQAHLEWMLNGNEKLFNCRADIGRGSLRLESRIADAEYVLLHTNREIVTNKIFRILRKGPRVVAASTIVDKGYPHIPSSPFYLVYDIGFLGSNDPLRRYRWDITKIPGWKGGRNSALPFGVFLTDLMTAVIPQAQ